VRRAAALCLLSLAAVAVASQAATGSSGREAACGTKVTFLVWPHGHAAIPSIRFPEIRNPHVEMYLGFDSRYPESRAGAYIIGGKPAAAFPRSGVLGPCLNYGDTVTKGTVAGGKTLSRKSALRCVLSASPVVDVLERPKGVVEVWVHAGRKVLAYGRATPTGATLVYSAAGCRAVAAPA
jgi:hypothetical protein